MKFSEWIIAADEDLPDYMSETRPLSYVVLAKVIDDTEGVCVIHWRSDDLSFWEAIGMMKMYEHDMLMQAYGAEEG